MRKKGYWARSGPSPQCRIHRFRAFCTRPREAPGLSTGGLLVARRQVTLKPPPPGSHQNAKGRRLLTGALVILTVRAVTQPPSGLPGPKHQDVDAPISLAVEPFRQADPGPSASPRLAPGRRSRLDLRNDLVGDMGAYVGKIENARFSVTIDTIEKIAHALEVDADVLFEPR